MAVVFFASCDDPYTPDATLNPQELLVVEGFIEMAGSTTIKLSKTMKLAAGDSAKNVTNALVSIWAEDNSNYPLENMGNGTFASQALNLNPALRYRLKINLQNASYYSDFVEAKVAAPIDSIYWESQPDGVQLYLNTHDPSGNSRYYRWSYEEAWEFRSAFYAVYIFDVETNTLRLRERPEEKIPNTCYASATSTNISINNSNALTDDIIYRFPFYKIKLNSSRLQEEYSILVYQYALTKEAYQYWESLKKNSDLMGSIFDPQPYQLKGNIHRENSDENVIGYISAGIKSSKRIFIDKQELPVYPLITEYSNCLLVYDREGRIKPDNYRNFPLGAYPDPLHPSISVNAYTSLSCVDCRLHGSEFAPSFWK